jgi:hypothetical protein
MLPQNRQEKAHGILLNLAFAFAANGLKEQAHMYLDKSKQLFPQNTLPTDIKTAFKSVATIENYIALITRLGESSRPFCAYDPESVQDALTHAQNELLAIEAYETLAVIKAC